MRRLPARGPAWWRPRPVDALVVLAVLALSLEPLWGGLECECEGLPAWGVVLVVVQCTVLLWRRSAPFATALVAGGLTAVQGLSSLPEPSLPSAALVGLYTVAALGSQVRARAAAAIGAAAIALALLLDPAGPPTPQDVTFFYLVFATAWLLGDGVRHRRDQIESLRERSAALEQTRAARERQVVAEERASIARELHDVIAHSVGVMVVQAESGAVLAARDPGRTEEAFDAIGRSGREALVELRQLLGVLHEQDDAAADRPADRSPQPGLALLPDLTAEVGAAGLDVELVVIGDPQPLAPAVDLSAFRIVQEALTNVLRHAHARSARVVVSWTPDTVQLVVSDDGSAGDGAVPRQGRGLVGMRERAAVVGGEVHAGPATGPGWEVRAALPVGPTRPVEQPGVPTPSGASA